MKLVDSYLKNSPTLSKEEAIEIIQLIKGKKGFIYPQHIADNSGVEISDVEKFLLFLSVKSFLKHYIVPKDINRVRPEDAMEGFDFDKFHVLYNEEDGYYDEAINDNLLLLSAYKKNA